MSRARSTPCSPRGTGIASALFTLVGLAEPLREALAPAADQIKTAFVFGLIAKKTDTSGSDIDLMVVSDSLSHADLYPLLEGASRQLGRTINPSIYTSSDLAKGRKTGGAFLKRIMAQPKLWVIGEARGISA